MRANVNVNVNVHVCVWKNLFLFLENHSVLLLRVFSLQPLPWKRALQKVHEDVPDAFQIVPPGLFDPEVVVDGGVPRGSCQRPLVSVRNVLQILRVSISLQCK